MNNAFETRIRNDLPGMESLIHSANHFMESHALTPDPIYKVNLAIEEMISNIIKYGYDDSNEHWIDVELSVEEDHLLLRIEDDGHEFDPIAADTPDIGIPLHARKIGGLGIHLVRNLCHDMRYRRDGRRNVLEIRIRSNGDREP